MAFRIGSEQTRGTLIVGLPARASGIMVAGAAWHLQAGAQDVSTPMLFFFELFLFVLVMLTLALGEFVSRGLALGLWGAVTAFALIGYLLARKSLANLADVQEASGPRARSPEATPEPTAGESPSPGQPVSESDADAPSPLDEKWARTLLYNWRRSNVLLLVGVVAVGVWYWLGRA